MDGATERLLSNKGITSLWMERNLKEYTIEDILKNTPRVCGIYSISGIDKNLCKRTVLLRDKDKKETENIFEKIDLIKLVYIQIGSIPTEIDCLDLIGEVDQEIYKMKQEVYQKEKKQEKEEKTKETRILDNQNKGRKKDVVKDNIDEPPSFGFMDFLKKIEPNE